MQQMGVLLGRHFTTIQKWETGERIPPGLAMAEIERMTGDLVRASSFVRRAPGPVPPTKRARREAGEDKKRCRAA